MIFRKSTRHALLTSAALAALAAPLAVEAQEITSAIQGRVAVPTGEAASGATVTVVDTRTGTSRTVSTSGNGTFNVRNLTVGGPYSVRIEAQGFEPQVITDIYIDASGSARLPITLSAADAGVEEIVVSASAINFNFTAMGPSSSFSESQIRDLPSISRNINDVIRLDPRVTFQGGGISCLGANNNFNAFTVDGVRAGDGFGLNGTGNLARNTFPIPFDSVGSASVEFSPVDVQYGQFAGCQINVLTKSGTNEFHGSAFFLYNNDDLVGDSIDGEDFGPAPFDRYNWGAELGGPIIKDKLFFYGSYEEFDTAAIQNDGPEFLGFGDPIDERANEKLTQAEIDRFAAALGQYGRDPNLLTVVRNNPRTNRRFFGRLDWNINDQHRAEFTYARLEELTQEADALSDIGRGGGFQFRDSFENSGTESDAYSLRVFSDWTDNLSTEFRISRQTVEDQQGPVGGGEAQESNIPRISVNEFAGANSPFFGQRLSSGPGVFRSANQLDYETDQIKFKADYVAGDHLLTVGYELDSVEVFNLFAVNATGTIFFDSLDDLEAGIASGVEGRTSFSGDINDAAAEFKRDIHSIYAQDEWSVTDRLTLIAGLRYDWYKSSDRPTENPVFEERYGFKNNKSFNGLDIFLPRVGVTWDAPEETFGQTSVSAGFGVFSVAGPTVWFANSFQNFGGALGNSRGGNCTAEDLQVIQNGQFTGLPACVTDEAMANAQANAGRVDAVDPSFELPSEQRFNISLSHTTDFGGNGFFDGWDLQADFIYSKTKDAVDFVDIRLTPNGEFLPDGRPQTIAVDPTQAGCDAVFAGPRNGFTNIDEAACSADIDVQDILLTNVRGSGGRKYNVSFQASKNFQLGDRTDLDIRTGYAWSDVTLVNTGQNSTATSGYENTVINYPNSTPLAPAVFQTKHNFTLSATLSHAFFEDYRTSLTAVFRAQSGSPYSRVLNARSGEATFGDSDNEARILPYIPTGPNDPLVQFADGFDTAAFFSFLDRTGLSKYAGEVAPRNRFTGPSSADLDLRFQQELPGFFGGDKFKVFVDFENFLNFIDSGAGVKRFIDADDVPEGVPFVLANVNDEGQYVYSDFSDRLPTPNVGQTLWRVNMGIRYEF